MEKKNLIILPHINFLFDRMLMNSFVHTNSLLIIDKHDELTKFIV